MNETQLLSDALFKSPDDFTLVAVLIEHLECDCDYWRSEAEKKVESIQQVGRDHRDLCNAVKLLERDNPVRDALVMHLYRTHHLHRYAMCNVCVIAGASAPVVTDSDGGSPGDYWADQTMTIGATWLLKYYRENRWRIRGVSRRNKRRRY